jgi:predicted TIM-barrel fold metal-dependent hydrolase
MYPVYEKCVELGIPVLFHAGVVHYEKHIAHYGTPIYLDQVATDLPELNIVIAHLGGNFSFEALVIAEKHQNVYMDTAFLPWFCERSLPRVEPLELIQRAVKFVGPDRILYGCAGLAPEVVLESGLDAEVKEKIMHGNAQRLLGLT